MAKNKSGAKGRGWKIGKPQLKHPGPTLRKIAMIDMGPVRAANGDPIHSDLPAHVVEPNTGWVPPAKPSRSGHALEVAGILAARIDEIVTIEHYNVFSEAGIDFDALKSALARIALEAATPTGARVVNCSIGIDTGFPQQPGIEAAIQACLAAEVFIVAASGESGDPNPAFPANMNGVIAVGGGNPRSRPIRKCNQGVDILAPGEAIQVMEGNDSYRRQDGSSYAAASLTAAVWLAIQKGNNTSVKLAQFLDANSKNPNRPDPIGPNKKMLDL